MNKFLEVRCKICREVEKRFDAYYMIYKYAGAFSPLRIDLCSTCWTSIGLPKVILKVEKEVSRVEKEIREENAKKL